MSNIMCLSALTADMRERDLTKCCFYQGGTTGLLQSSDEGYKLLGSNIPLFHIVNAHPISLDIRQFNDRKAIKTAMKETKC